MSLLDIIKIVGFGTGAALHFYIAWLILKRLRSGLGSGSRAASANLPSWPANAAWQPSDAPGFIDCERTFIVLGLCLGLWFLGNVLITFQEVLVGPGRWTGFLRAWNTITVIGIALFPSALLHSHIAFWSWLDGYRVLGRGKARLASTLSYVPMVFLPYVVFSVDTGDYKPYLSKLHFFLVPYSIWFLLAVWLCASLDWKMKDRLYEWAVREMVFLKVVSVLLFLLGAIEFFVVAVRRTGPDSYVWVAFILLSLLPTLTIAYYIYRYGLYDLAIKGSLVYATFAVLFLVVYTYGIRHLDAFLVKRFDIKAGVVEAVLILAMFAAAGPLVRLIDRAVRRLFASEIELYRDVVRKIDAATGGSTGADQKSGTAPGRIGDLGALIGYAEDTIRIGLGLSQVRIIVSQEKSSDGVAGRAIEGLAGTHGSSSETNGDVAAVGGPNAYSLVRQGRQLGLMILTAEPGLLTSEKRAVLEVLAGQVATGIETFQLVEEKVKLERELAMKERLAVLGQMAATVAHEVKNPLSSIKSIAQVMREDEAVGDYSRDLDLIVDEVDRLSRTVSQLLAFARKGAPQVADSGQRSIGELVASAAALIAADAERAEVLIRTEVKPDVMLSGPHLSAMKEIVSNLLLNAVQSSPTGAEVVVEVYYETESPSNLDLPAAGPINLVLKVTDGGPGITVDEQTRIFEPFYTTRPRGTGLGLAIVRRRVSDLGGSVCVASPVTDNFGTSFIVTLPVGAGLQSAPDEDASFRTS